ncbi:hypothetical protein GSI_13132 [Ganoderma sinense ZZ0214-1]|uniref:Uncharacterized protein n=1 Tax=Ganoderma sinense ZZ0214-1 TaxID=1077348 RepID=A0A2G8RUR2_9APHY|nr:hypothetical protein GSI_13132 [Ganoderma sinense ZZ0214-1]
MTRRPGIANISKAHPSVDENMVRVVVGCGASAATPHTSLSSWLIPFFVPKFTVFSFTDLEQPGTRAPPLVGVVDDNTDLEEYNYYPAKKGKKPKASVVPNPCIPLEFLTPFPPFVFSKAAPPVPIAEPGSADESDASGPINPMNCPPAHPLSPPSTRNLARPPHQRSSPLRYEDPESLPDSATNASNAPRIVRQVWSDESSESLGGGGGGSVVHTAYSLLAVRPNSSPPPFHGQPSMPLPLPHSGAGEPVYPSLQYAASSTLGNIPAPSARSPATYAAPGLVAYPPTRIGPVQEGSSTARMGSRVPALQPPARRTQGGRKPVARSETSASGMVDPSSEPHRRTPRYNPYALDGRRPSQTAMAMVRCTQVAGQLERVPAVPTYPVQVGAPWASTSALEEDLETVPLGYGIPPWQATPRGENFVYPTEEAAVDTYGNPRVLPNQTVPIWTPSPSSSFSGAPSLDGSSSIPAVPQLLPTAVYGDGEWSPIDGVDLQALQLDMMGHHPYNSGGPSASRHACQ